MKDGIQKNLRIRRDVAAEFVKISTILGLKEQEAKMDGNYRFIMNRYMKLKKGEIKWATPDQDAEDMMVHGDRICIYCGAPGDLTKDHRLRLKQNP
jgi:hypothetical protein